jgi:sphingolipid 8-(E)-desaturase
MGDIKKTTEESTKEKIDKVWTLKELRSEETMKKYKWSIINRKVYNLKSWIHCHPGGDLTISHFLYKDATDHFACFHPAYVAERILPKFYIGKLNDSETVLTDSILSKDFKRLTNELYSRGLFKVRYSFYLLEMLKCFILLFISFWLNVSYNYESKSTILYLCSSFFLASFWHQVAFVGHDLGHNGVTGILKIDHVLGIIVGNFLGAISIGWWKDTHYVHHAMTNDPEADPDIQLMPFLAITTKFFQNIFSSYHNRTIEFDRSCRFFVRIQHYLYYLILMFGKANLLVQSLIFLSSNKRAKMTTLEYIGFIFFLSWVSILVSYVSGFWNKVLFVILSNAIVALLHVQITISHYAMDTEQRDDEKEEFVKHQMRTTMDVECSPWFDWLHGGLQFQAIHHLFPRMPRHNLRQAKDYVIEFCTKHNIEYKRYSFITGNIVVINHLAYVARCSEDETLYQKTSPESNGIKEK